MDAPNPALEQFIRSIPLFALVEPHEMMDILRLLRPVELRAGQVLFREGTPAQAMWVLGSGVEVSISATPPGNKRPVVVAYARAGDTVGEMALVDDGNRSGTAVVMQGGPAHEIDAREFQVLRRTYHSAAYKVLRRICMDLCAKLRATAERIAPSSQTVVSAPPLPPGRPAPVEVLDGLGPFQSLPKVVKLALAQKLTLLELDGVTPLFAEGEPADAAYFIVSGEVTVGRGGKTLANLGPGAMFGMVSAIDEGTRSASCLTTGPARLLRLKDADFDALFAQGHRFAFAMVDLVARQLVQHLRQANRLLSVPGARGASAGSPPVSVAPLSEEEVLPEAEILESDVLPLELEMALEDEVVAIGELLGGGAT